MRIASWNVNSIKVRLDIVTRWLAIDPCDVLLIQETKSLDVIFPIDAF
jgi:exodeoxyribonuclease-3